MKSLKPSPTRAGGVGAARRARKPRTLAAACVALVAALALVSSTSASLTASRAGLGGSTSSDRSHFSSTEANAARPAAGPETSRRPNSSPAAPTLFAAPLQAEEAVEILDGDCDQPKAAFNLGETVCARVSNAALGGSEFFPLIPLRKLSWINPAGLQVQADIVSAAAGDYTFTIPSDETSTFGDRTVDNRGGWRVVLASIFDSSERVAAGFTASKPGAAAADLSVLTTQEQRQERVPAGSQAPFLIIVENKGPDAAADVELRVPVPNFTTFLSVIPPAGFTCDELPVGTGPSGTLVCSADAPLAPGAPATFTAVFLIGGETAADAEVEAVATIASTTAERHQPDNTSAASYLVASQPQCVIHVPQDITVNNDIVGGQPSGGAVVTYGAPTTEGNCGTVTCDPPSGAFFPVGENSVTCTNASQSAIERFTVTVIDTRQPIISCPADLTVPETTPGAGEAIVNFPAPTVNDNDANVQVTFDPPSGLPLPLGEHTVTATATDAAGNTASCSFKVTVVPRQGECAITPDVANLLTITSECSAVASVIPTATDSCFGKIGATTDDPRSFDEPGTYTINWKYTSAGGATVTQTQTVVVTPGSGTLTITGAPAVAVAVSAGAPDCAVVISDLGAVLNTNIGGSCSGVDVTRTVTPAVNDNTYPAGVYTVVSTVTNGTSTASITQTLRVVDGVNPTVSAPADATYECAANVPAADAAQATGSDNCGPVTLSVTEATNGGAGSPASPLVITRTFTATDAGGRTASDSQVITVVDTTKPVITVTGANPLTVECHTSFTDPGATAADNCDASVPVSASGAVDVNTPGTYTITYTATDDAGNAATPVTRTVNVVDTTPPTIACPPDITVYLPLNSPAVSMPVSFAVTAGDSCDSTPSVALSHAPGSIFPVGTTTVTATATDDAGNSASCAFNVTVLYNFTGFFSPVDNPPTLNQVNAGRAIPVKFSLSGNKGLAVFAAGSPASQQVTCNSSAPISELTETLTAGSSSLSYDASSDRYNYVWKTEGSWAGTCRQLVVKLNDGSSHTALFKFK
ncbi:MAG TPA: PxKF domain-containing protein [Pyrinomonadaceae bacterium]|nr:PxKF domain-containing protein [Pyrinomonadaceae bacterium]